MKSLFKPSTLWRNVCVISVFAAAYLAILLGGINAQNGEYFSKKGYLHQPLAEWCDTRGKLPSPIDDEHPLWIKLYWKAWEVAFIHFHEPGPHSVFVSQLIEPAFNENTAQWDSSFKSMFCNYGYPLVPGISSLDNFYARQYSDGEICREINWSTGLDFREWTNQEDKPLFSREGWPLNPAQDPSRVATSIIYKDRAVPS